ncbi:MAG: xanthine dehydrogenase, molybdenum binding subunit apoprotein [Actinomycetia bacterium]|jgi:carbon-monoxide dehydrogenase large subunit|nr:xanthine dehydrogenase, molybdenum binding subunit apoprotein [Actinomycetes bacterium]
MATTETFIGQPVLRKEDPELLTGHASYIDNWTMPGMLWMALARPPYVHATIDGIDTTEAASMPGVVGVYTATDFDLAPLPFVWPITEEIKVPVHYPLASDKVRFNGDAVAVVLAETREQALDAAEAVAVTATELPAVIDIEEAAKDEVIVHDDLGTNVVVHWSHGGGGDQSVFDSAPVIVQERYVQPRLIPNAIETRGCLAYGVPPVDEWTLVTATQIPHIAKVTLAGTTGIDEHKLRVIAPDVGGGFGSKLNVYAEEALALALARRLRRPVKWIEGRRENYVATTHGRGVLHDCTLAGTEDGTILGMKFVELADMGAYYQLLTPGIPELGGWVYMGPYDPKAYWFEFKGVVTNTTPTDAYRGAGRPEATYVIERLVDSFARRIGKDPADIRRMNLHPPHEDAQTSIMGLNVDSANYEPLLDKALGLVEYDKLRAEQRDRRERGDRTQLGIGLSTYIEMCGLAPSNILGALRYAAGGWDGATIECLPSGHVIVKTGTSPHGQSHETAWAQIVADGLGVSPDEITVLHGDTHSTPLGMDTYGSRSVAVGGVALHFAVEKIKAKARTIAAHELEVAEDDLEWADGAFRVKGAPDTAKTIPELAVSAWHAHALPAEVEPHLNATAVYDPPNFTWPAGAHVCVVEVDTETGATEIVRYVAVDDCGTIINPMIVEGQVHGGVAQGVAEALYEEAMYDESGNLTTSTMTQYLIPSATEIPAMTTDHSQETPSTTNPLGVKGIGEAGTIAAPPAVVNAVIDAVSHLGVTAIEKPASPERVWRAIQEAKGDGRAGASPGSEGGTS